MGGGPTTLVGFSTTQCGGQPRVSLSVVRLHGGEERSSGTWLVGFPREFLQPGVKDLAALILGAEGEECWLGGGQGGRGCLCFPNKSDF